MLGWTWMKASGKLKCIHPPCKGFALYVCVIYSCWTSWGSRMCAFHSPRSYFYFDHWIIIKSKVILIFCLKRPQLNIHSFWCGLLGSFFGMCVRDKRLCFWLHKLWLFQRDYIKLSNLFHWSTALFATSLIWRGRINVPMHVETKISQFAKLNRAPRLLFHVRAAHCFTSLTMLAVIYIYIYK